MKLVGGFPFWLIRSGLLFDYPVLQESVNTEVLIVGGGISGALLGYQLTNEGVPCLIVDSRTIGLGSTCASTSLLQYEIDTPLSVLKDKVGEDNAVAAYRLNAQAINELAAIHKAIGCNEFSYKKSLLYAAKKKHVAGLKKEVAMRQKFGFEVQWLDSEETKTRFDLTVPGAILSETAGQTDSYKFTHALHQHSMQRGLRVFDRTEVVDVSYEAGGIKALTNNGYTITAAHIIYANGYEAVNYIENKLVDVNVTYAVASEQLPGSTPLWNDDLLIWNTDDPYLYCRTTNDRRIIVGGRDEAYRRKCNLSEMVASKSKQLKKDFEKLFPKLRFRNEFAWSGTFINTKDGLPFIGSLKQRPNTYFALGFGGNGITFSQVAAEIITALITKGVHEYGKIFSFERADT